MMNVVVVFTLSHLSIIVGQPEIKLLIGTTARVTSDPAVGLIQMFLYFESGSHVCTYAGL